MPLELNVEGAHQVILQDGEIEAVLQFIRDNLPEAYEGFGAEPNTRYVTLDGNDLNPGTFLKPKRTIADAVKSLPTAGSGGQKRNEGKLWIGGGQFVEEDLPIPYDAGVQYEGIGTGTNTTQIVQGAADHLFARSPSFTDWHHHVTMTNLRLVGDPANFPGPYDLLSAWNTGFNFKLDTVFFANAARHGLAINSNAVNCYLYNCTAGGCKESAIWYKLPSYANLHNFGSWGLQIDNCGDYPVQIVAECDGGTNVIEFHGTETEAFNTNPIGHDAIYKVTRNSGANPPWIKIGGGSTLRAGGGGTAMALEDGAFKSKWLFENCHVDGYGKVFKSNVVTGRESTGTNIFEPESFQ